MKVWRILALVAFVAGVMIMRPLQAQLECQTCYAWQQQQAFQKQAQCCFTDDDSCSSITSQHSNATPQTTGQGCEIEPVEGGYQCVPQPPCDDGSGGGSGGGGGGGGNCTVRAGAGCPAECASCQHLLF